MDGQESEPVGAEAAADIPESENARVVREGYALWNDDRFDEAIERFWHPNAVMYHLAGWPEPGPSVGREAIAAQFARIRREFAADRLEVLELRDLGHAIVVRARWIVRGSGSDAQVSTEMSPVYWFENGLVVRTGFYREHEQALEAAGR